MRVRLFAFCLITLGSRAAGAQPVTVPPRPATLSATDGSAALGNAPAVNEKPVPAPAPVTAPVESVAVATERGVWKTQFLAARGELLEGRSRSAEASLEELASRAMTPEDARAAKELADVARALRGRNLVIQPRQDARIRSTDELTSLYLYGAIYGAGTGFWLATAAGAQSSGGQALPAVILAAGGVGVVAALDSMTRYKLKYGAPQALVSGLSAGLVEGALVAGWHQSVGAPSLESGRGAIVGAMWLGATGGALAGALTGQFTSVTPGRAAWVGSCGLWSGVSADLIALTLGADASSTQFATALVGYNLGLAGGLLSATSVSPSISRARLLDLGGALGGVIAGGLYFALAGDGANVHAAAAVTGVGVLAGLGGAWKFTSGMDEDRIEERLDPTNLAKISYSPTVAPVAGGLTAGLGGTF